MESLSQTPHEGAQRRKVREARKPGFAKPRPERSRLMSRVKQRDTPQELTVRSIVHSLGFRFRKNVKGLPGTPDIANKTARWCIFVNGCYWHAHGCALSRVPRTNRKFWETKFKANRERDQRKVRQLKERDFAVKEVWQCELEDEDAVAIAILEFLEQATRRKPGLYFRYLPKRRQIARTVLLETEARSSVAEAICSMESTDAHSAFDQSFLRGAEIRSRAADRGTVGVADLFCGCGGLTLGVREACRALGLQFSARLAMDNTKSALEVYKANFSPAVSNSEDIEKVLDGNLGAAPTEKEGDLLNALGRIDAVLAGPPCQGHSDLNNQTRRSDGRNSLYERVARFAELASPRHILIENVPAVVHDERRALSRTRKHLDRLGYATETSVIRLAELGVPQLRKRHVLLASQGAETTLANIVEKQRTAARSLEWAIRDLEHHESEGIFDSASRPNPDNLKRIRYLFDSGKLDLPNRLRPRCHQIADHSYKSMYGRLSWDEPAQTITGGFGSPGQGRFIHPSRPRTLTPHEAARVQFFPDSFDFSTVNYRTHLASMIGNAVPMALSFTIFLELLQAERGGEA